MRCIGARRVEKHDGNEWWLCVIVHDQELDTYTLTGADVEGMNDDDLISEGSLIATPTANYIAFRPGVFTQSELASGGGGGGGGTTAGVASFNARTGNVYPRSGDYYANQIGTASGDNVQTILDQLQAAVELDPTLSVSSTKGVQNRAITLAINELRGMCLPAGGAAGDILAKVDGNNYNAQWINGDGFMRKSEYDPDNNGKVNKAETADALQGPGTYVARMKSTNGDTYVVTDKEKGTANGVVPLDNNRKILPEYLPDNIYGGMTYGGIFNATTRVVRLTEQAKSILGVSSDTMTLQNSSTVPEGYPANVELYYVTKTAGTFAGMNFDVGDWLISIGTEWQHLEFGSKVSSVNNQTGVVELDTDQVPQGGFNLYMTAAEKTKLQNIEAEATKDVNVVQTAQVIEDTEGNKTLRLVNKNGTVVNFAGGGTADLADYLKKTGDGSQVFAQYTKAAQAKPVFSGNETEAIFRGKVQAWLDALDSAVIYWSDIQNRPTKLSEFTNDGNGNSAYPFITKQVTDLQNYYKKDQTYSKTEVDDLLDALTGMNFIEVPELPTENIDPNAIYLVPKTGGGYKRWWHSATQGWLDFGDTDVDLSDYLKVDGDGSAVTVDFTAGTKEMIETGDTLAEAFGKLVAYLTDLKAVAFSNEAADLDDYADLALKTDLDDYVEIDQGVAHEGKVLGIGADGKVAPTTIAAGVMRRGDGVMSMIGNDTADDPKNEAAGDRATALGNGTKASSDDQVAIGRYNVEDLNDAYAFMIGGGTPSAPMNIATVDWSGNIMVRGGAKLGNTTDNIFTPTAGNDATTKNYVDATIDTKIAEADLLKAMIVDEIPDVEDADDNILYLIADPTAQDSYLTYKKVLISQNPDVYHMAAIGSTQVQASESQVAVLPTPSIAFANKVYQYIGSDSAYDFGMFYACKNQGYYAWLSTTDAKYYYTTKASPVQYDAIYDENFAKVSQTVKSVSGTTLTDSNNKTYTRLSAQDTAKYEWQEVNSKLSEYVNDGTGTGAPNDYFVTRGNALSQGTDMSSVTASTKLSKVNSETGEVTDVTIQKIWDFMWKKIYPVGKVYTSVDPTSPATLFGGTWTKIGDGYYLRASTSGGGNTLNEQLPNVTGSFRFSSGSQGHPEVSSPSGAFKTATNGNLTYPWPTDGTSGGPRTVNFSLKYFNDSLYVDNGVVQPKSFKVYMWQRTA